MSEINVILAPMAGRTVCTTKTVYQYNSGMVLRFVGIDLPEAYVVDFANSVTGTSISQVGGENGVTIPDQFFTPGSTIHAWYVATGTGYAVTRYHIMIPISPRASRTNEEPTPSQQSALDEAIAALNNAVDAAETAITHYPKVDGGYWYIWDVTAGEYVSTGVQAQGPQGDPGLDGVSPEITVANITGGHRITITDADGTKTVDVMDGTDGDDGVGISSIVKTGTSGLADTYTITYTDGTTETFTVTNGKDGDPGTPGVDGFSPTITATDITGGHRVTVTDANGTRSFDVMDGEDYTLTAADKAEIAQQAAAEVDLPTVATTSQVKAGTDSEHFLAPSVQDNAVFYALAKAAGANMASSSNPVGTYTDAAKVAIQKMLGVNETFDLLETINLTDTGSDIVTTRNSDMQGVAYAYDAFVVDIETTQSTTLICGVFAGASDARTKLVSYNRASKKRFRLYVFSLGSGLWWAIGMDDSGSSGTITPSSSYSPITNATDKISYVSAELKTGFESATIKLFGMKK